MNLLPRSLAGQLIGLLCLGLVVAHVAAHPFSGRAGRTLQRNGYGQVLERYPTTHRALVACGPSCDADGLIAALSTRGTSFWLVAAPPPAHDMDAEEAALAADLAGEIGPADQVGPAGGSAAGIDVRISRLDTPLLEGLARVVVEVHAPAPDGRWLTAEIHTSNRTFLRYLGTTVLVSIVPVLLIVALFARRLLRPLRALTQAAERVSRREPVGLLKQEGPGELREVAAAFNAMQERLARFVADRTRMMAAISHDFRTPITSLRLRVEMVEDPPLRTAMIRTLDEMRQMVEETLRFAEDESDHERVREIDLSVLLERVGQEQRALGRDVTWQLPAALPYRCRPLALTRAVTNLLENAIRYGKRARVTLALAQDTARHVRIAVEDDGPGIPAEWQERVFEPFARPDKGRSQKVGGVGLGLSIARSCVEAHGGRIALANRPGGGLSATILLPTAGRQDRRPFRSPVNPASFRSAG